MLPFFIHKWKINIILYEKLILLHAKSKHQKERRNVLVTKCFNGQKYVIECEDTLAVGKLGGHWR